MNIFAKYQALSTKDKVQVIRALISATEDQYVALSFKEEGLYNVGVFDEVPALTHWDLVLRTKDLEHSLGLQGALEHELLNLEFDDE